MPIAGARDARRPEGTVADARGSGRWGGVRMTARDVKEGLSCVNTQRLQDGKRMWSRRTRTRKTRQPRDPLRRGVRRLPMGEPRWLGGARSDARRGPMGDHLLTCVARIRGVPCATVRRISAPRPLTHVRGSGTWGHSPLSTGATFYFRAHSSWIVGGGRPPAQERKWLTGRFAGPMCTTPPGWAWLPGSERVIPTFQMKLLISQPM